MEVDQRVVVRMRGQERLTDDDPLHLTTAMSETTLLQQVGGPDVLRAQFEHIIEMIEKHPDTVRLQIMKSGYSNTTGAYLKVKCEGERVLVRDSKNRHAIATGNAHDPMLTTVLCG